MSICWAIETDLTGGCLYVTSVSKKMGQSTVVICYCALSQIF